MGHAGRVAGTYEWVVRGLPYIIVYQTGAADSDEALILGVSMPTKIVSWNENH
jgi:toxin ParE1/3/4